MDYEKKYKQLHTLISDLYPFMSEYCKEKIEGFFPEIRESEDERIRKALIENFELLNGKQFKNQKWGAHEELLIDDILAWLEKQGEQKPFFEFKAKDWYVSEVDGKIHNMTYNPTDKIEPKFKVGDWLIDDKNVIGVVTRLLDEHYIISFNGREEQVSFAWESRFRKWNISDAKSGDVLYSPCCNLLWIYKDERTCYVGNNLNYNICIPSDTHPATKEQRDTLFAKIKDAGYEWDAENKKLKKINSYCQENCKGFQETGKCFVDGDCKAKIEAEQKTATWSEKDEKMLVDAYVMLDWYKGNNWWTARRIKDWLKALKQRIGG